MADLERISEDTKKGEELLATIDREIRENDNAANSWLGSTFFLWFILVLASLSLNLKFPQPLVILLGVSSALLTCIVFYKLLTKLRRLRRRYITGVEWMRGLAKDCRSLNLADQDTGKLYPLLCTLKAYEGGTWTWDWLENNFPIISLFYIFLSSLLCSVAGCIVLMKVDESTLTSLLYLLRRRQI